MPFKRVVVKFIVVEIVLKNYALLLDWLLPERVKDRLVRVANVYDYLL